jgi:2-polyprenyl-3-methyl-5-hydroxy-6-metoxy-1,4-benzoquinol methylase
VTTTGNGATRVCPVCGARPTRALHVRDQRRILRCGCGLVLIDPLPSAEAIAAREGEAFRGELMDETKEMFAAYGRNYRHDDPVVTAFQHHLATLGRLTPGRRLLDVGIGTGLLVHLARAAGWDAAGVEICAEAAERARREFDIPVTTGDFAAVDVQGGFDAITMADVLEHTRDPRAFLEAARERLRPGGVLYVAVPNHRSLVFLTADLLGKVPGGGGIADRLYVPNHYTYFTPATLTRLARDVGFEVAAVARENPYLGRYQMHPVIRAGLATLLAVSRATGLESRVVLFARRPGGAQGA